jgi:hypothetical protein
MLPSSRRQLTVMVNSIGQPNIAWPRPSTGPQVFTGLRLRATRQPGFDAALNALRRGEYSHRLETRATCATINVIHDLSARSIGFKVLTGHGALIDTTTVTLHEIRRLE